MKRDWSLLHVILAHVESETIDKFLDDMDGKWVEGQTLSDRYSDSNEKAKAVILEHVRLLVEGKYVDGIEVNFNGKYGYGMYNPRLTNSGHDLLQAFRSESLWGKIKQIANEKGLSLSLQVIKEIIPYALKRMFE